MWGVSERPERVAWVPPRGVLEPKEKRRVEVMLDGAKGEQRVERWSKAAKRLESWLWLWCLRSWWSR